MSDNLAFFKTVFFWIRINKTNPLDRLQNPLKFPQEADVKHINNIGPPSKTVSSRT